MRLPAAPTPLGGRSRKRSTAQRGDENIIRSRMKEWSRPRRAIYHYPSTLQSPAIMLPSAHSKLPTHLWDGAAGKRTTGAEGSKNDPRKLIGLEDVHPPSLRPKAAQCAFPSAPEGTQQGNAPLAQRRDENNPRQNIGLEDVSRRLIRPKLSTPFMWPHSRWRIMKPHR